MFEHVFAPIRIRDMELKKQDYPGRQWGPEWRRKTEL